MKICFHIPHFLFAAFLLTSALALSAQNGAASALEQVRIAMLQEDYRTAAKEASKLYFLTSDSAVAEEALNLSVSANLAIRNAGGKVSESFSIRISKAAKRLLLLTAEGTICRSFELECGADFSVPSGDFTVGTKLAYPNYELNGQFYKFNRPGNTLGSRWIELRNAEGTPVSGIHGEAPQTAESEHLFFRLKNSDINEIFVLLSEGGTVLVM
ncbi:MAG TPA: hypothetical protein DDZ11_10785 [Lentisphaeria bacterium]|nr:hypothetical protein [Lentisphaeria bacterium]